MKPVICTDVSHEAFFVTRGSNSYKHVTINDRGMIGKSEKKLLIFLLQLNRIGYSWAHGFVTSPKKSGRFRLC